MPEFSFTKGERLSSRKTISALFQSGKAIYVPPLKLLFMRAEGIPYPVEAAISVPKRLYKRAVDRNLLKRRIREAYRINKSGFYTWLRENELQLYLVIQYHHKEIVDYHTIEKGLKKALEQVLLKLEKSH